MGRGARRRAALATAATAWLALGCATIAPGPGVTALPGTGSSLAGFEADDGYCRDEAWRRTGDFRGRAVGRGVATAAVGAGIGAALGAAIGAAVGHPGIGAAIGAGGGLASAAPAAAAGVHQTRAVGQDRFDAAYVQCMYALGHQVPVARDSVPVDARTAVPRSAPPPYGRPPPPPPELR